MDRYAQTSKSRHALMNKYIGSYIYIQIEIGIDRDPEIETNRDSLNRK